MNHWGATTYGDPCLGCAFSWDADRNVLIARMTGLPEEYEDLLSSADGGERHPDLGWTVGEYVVHVADNLRIWAERLVSSAAGRPWPVVPYDQDTLAGVRSYRSIPLAGALWTLRRGVGDWLEAVGGAPTTGPVLAHPERGALTLDEVVSANTHDALHHRADIERTLTSGPA